MLTTSDIEQKTFSTALRGYDLDEVDDFLDEVVSTIKELSAQLEEARAARDAATVTPLPVPEAEPTSEPEVVPEPATELEAAPETRPEIDETAIGRALVAAQTAADKLLEDAQSEATRIVESARSEADSWSEERDAKKRQAEAEMAALASRVAAVRTELSVLAGEVSVKLDEMDSTIAGSIGDDAESGHDQDGNEPGRADGYHSHDDDVWLPMEAEDREQYPVGESEDSADSAGPDRLDEILNGVANDLQLDSGDDHQDSEEPDGDDRP